MVIELEMNDSIESWMGPAQKVCFWTGHRYRPDAGCQIEKSLRPTLDVGEMFQ